MPHPACREETVGASLGAGGVEVAPELWTQRVRCLARLSRFQRSFTVIMEGGYRMVVRQSRIRQSARLFANSGGITDM